MDDDGKIEGLRTLVDAVHGAGARVFAHLNHAGSAANPKASGQPPEAPSPVPCARTGITPQALDADRVRGIVGDFGNAARRSLEAGFDGLELQFGLGYLVAQFLSPRTNQRNDDFGVGGVNRWRFPSEVFRAVKDATAGRLAVTVRISADEKVKGGLGLEDAIELARRVQTWKADGIHVVTGSTCDTTPWYFQHMSLPVGVNEQLAAVIRDVVSVPVMVAGRLGDPDRIRSVLRKSGRCGGAGSSASGGSRPSTQDAGGTGR